MRRERPPLGDFLRARRDEVQPEDVGLTRGPKRRVPGLRREEVALMAGISPEYYLRLEQGKDNHRPSVEVIAAIGKALLLDADALHYLHRVAYPALHSVVTVEREPEVPDGVRDQLEQWSANPAFVWDRTFTVLAVNDLARVMAPEYLRPGINMIEQVFDAQWEPHREGWAQKARQLVASLRYHADPDDPRLHELVGGLSIRSPEFRRMWASHDARPVTDGHVSVQIEPLGWVQLARQVLTVPGDSGIQLTVMFAQPGTPAATAIAYLRARAEEEPAAPQEPLLRVFHHEENDLDVAASSADRTNTLSSPRGSGRTRR